MTKVLEAVAKGMWERNVAACGSLGIELDSWEDELPSLREDWLNLARASLIALRDGVTPGMIGAVEETGVGVYNDRIIAYWTGMIDHVLQEAEKE